MFSEVHFHLLEKEERISENVFKKVNLEKKKKVNQNLQAYNTGLPPKVNNWQWLRNNQTLNCGAFSSNNIIANIYCSHMNRHFCFILNSLYLITYMNYLPYPLNSAPQ